MLLNVNSQALILTSTLSLIKVESVARRADTSEGARHVNTSPITTNMTATFISIFRVLIDVIIY